jgi:hypothetical protein
MTTEQLAEITQPLENRITALEAELTQLKQLLLQPQHPWWHTVLGSFADCPDFDTMEQLGQTWRTAQNSAPDLD